MALPENSISEKNSAVITNDTEEDTIAAVATAMTEAGIGIIRISGRNAIAIGDRLFRDAKMRRRLSTYQANTLHFGYVIDPDTAENDEPLKLDEVMVSVMKAPHSYTTEDTVEINSHGGVYLMNRILELVLKNGARLAEPGEFTKRAFLGGRIDLAKAEAVMDLISSQNEFSRKTSMEQLEGQLSGKIRELRSEILHEMAFIESALDDPENYDTEGYPDQLYEKLNGLIRNLNQLLGNAENIRLLKEGIRTVIIGKPNAGKSSLLNILSHSDRAIVTDVAGTTRDTLEESVRLGDAVLHLVDTAGIRETEDAVEKIGVNRAIRAAESADLLLFLIDTSRPLTKEDEEIAALAEQKVENGCRLIVLLNKMDLPAIITKKDVERLFSQQLIEKDSVSFLPVSMTQHSGIDVLSDEIKKLFHTGALLSSNEIYVTHERHREAIRNAIHSLELVQNSIKNGMTEEFYSVDLMNAYSELGKILGEQVDDDLVEEIFSKFCLGK